MRASSPELWGQVLGSWARLPCSKALQGTAVRGQLEGNHLALPGRLLVGVGGPRHVYPWIPQRTSPPQCEHDGTPGAGPVPGPGCGSSAQEQKSNQDMTNLKCLLFTLLEGIEISLYPLIPKARLCWGLVEETKGKVERPLCVLHGCVLRGCKAVRVLL